MPVQRVSAATLGLGLGEGTRANFLSCFLIETQTPQMCLPLAGGCTDGSRTLQKAKASSVLHYLLHLKV